MSNAYHRCWLGQQSLGPAEEDRHDTISCHMAHRSRVSGVIHRRGRRGADADRGEIGVVTLIVVVLAAAGVAVRLYDLKRKRDDEVMSLQSWVSDALLRDRSLGGLAITAVATGSPWRRSQLGIAIMGTVPTPELRDSVMRVVHQEVSRRHPGVRAEDRLMVDPLIAQTRARSAISS